MIGGLIREVARGIQAGWHASPAADATVPESDRVDDMAKKGKKQRKRQAHQAELDRQRELHQEEWKAAWSPLQTGTGMKTEIDQIDRPREKCSECGLTFLKNDPFHYSKDGPIHGWGDFDEVATCRRLEQRKNSNKNNGSNWNRCLECGETVMNAEPSHSVKGGKIHGNGSWRDQGTCLIRHRVDLAKKLERVSEEFFQGKLSSDEVLAVIQETVEEETRMASYLESVDPAQRPDNKDDTEVEVESASKLVYSSASDDDTQEFEVIRPAGDRSS